MTPLLLPFWGYTATFMIRGEDNPVTDIFFSLPHPLFRRKPLQTSTTANRSSASRIRMSQKCSPMVVKISRIIPHPYLHDFPAPVCLFRSRFDKITFFSTFIILFFIWKRNDYKVSKKLIFYFFPFLFLTEKAPARCFHQTGALPYGFVNFANVKCYVSDVRTNSAAWRIAMEFDGLP